ncbi:MAG: phosphate signaling complex protein PhoU [Dehalococcoidia bacterium]|jgi:phosphate transport system protein|uniref:Phosphate-specific transport system accessory protein PhoU n=1 Tax=Tepidiforma bonchosmolovskayae TaxID=2601677 RepID=A0ABX6C3X8_9CHLR|nr:MULTISPECIES: phosphate signaling complex protein PhoU [Tepidiforma]MCL6644142.1 phosphate signaling complex protein PhoU [Dehalococcoidia bacterium]QFG03393.1 phosphate signaling complex protein PhoU [Tepidiforma bonchosmolovskayae]GIW16720.1 MAG: phosphate transport system regulatory protein PhoU [Tepidiforma sp.]
MTRDLFKAELRQLQDDVLTLGSMTEKAILDAMESLRDGDVEWSRRIIADDAKINRKRFEIEDRTIAVVATQQPMATDLRALVSVLYIITDLERIADHAEGVARINTMMEPEPLPRKLGYIPAMADRAVAMLRDSLKAYIDLDVDAARQICHADDEVDRLQDSVYEEAFRAMVADPSTIQRNTYLLWTAHNLERIADRCTNICERVIYTVTGHMDELNVSNY